MCKFGSNKEGYHTITCHHRVLRFFHDIVDHKQEIVSWIAVGLTGSSIGLIVSVPVALLWPPVLAPHVSLLFSVSTMQMATLFTTKQVYGDASWSFFASSAIAYFLFTVELIRYFLRNQPLLKYTCAYQDPRHRNSILG